MKKILFICTHNSSRSQMAEGLINTFLGDKYKGYSAGIHPTMVNPYVIKVMKEIGIDLLNHSSKSVEQFRGEKFNYVITLCENARHNIPLFPGVIFIHKEFSDPSKFSGTEDEIIAQLRLVRNEIQTWLTEIFN
ncbi:MAG: arsenate reductase ArsC [Candidatus Bathyarchaeota archaeon]